jgi:hypothetical protein
MEKMRNTYKIVGKPEGKRPLGRPRGKLEVHIRRVKVKLSLCFFFELTTAP